MKSENTHTSETEKKFKNERSRVNERVGCLDRVGGGRGWGMCGYLMVGLLKAGMGRGVKDLILNWES